MSLTVSIVIPTLNEALRLSVLLDRLAHQTRLPDEVIVADAQSTDGTTEIAASHGARVVPGGKPGAGRNSGASAATGDLILFFDADVEPPDTFVERAVAEFVERGLAVASVPVEPLEQSVKYSLVCGFANSYMRLLQRVSPHASGFGILVRREVHERVGGFDESLILAEDHDYVQRVSRVGRFGVLRSVSIPGSMRRIEKEGFLQSVRLFMYSERHTLAGRPIRHAPFGYEFAAYGDEAHPAERSRRAQRRPHKTSRRAQDLLRTLRKPSTEMQADAIGLQVASVLVGCVGTAGLAVAGLGPAAYAPFAGTALVVAGLSTFVVLWKLRYERRYGDFFMSSVAVTSNDLLDDEGLVLARKGVDEVCELHVIRGLARMSVLNRQGSAGRLTIVLETLEGIRSLLDDMDSRLYRDVTVVTARSDLVGLLFKMGFDEITDPPRYDFVNRLEKRLLMTFVGMVAGRDRSTRPEDYRMAVIPREKFTDGPFRITLDRQIDRVARNLARLQERRNPAMTG